MIALSRAGSRMFWHTLPGKPADISHPRGQLSTIAVLLFGAVLLTIFAEPVSDFTSAIANDLSHPQNYINAVLQLTGADHE
jgi:multicomponent K+:H+ antiporter subunit D